MKTLYLIRHAKSSWDYPHLSDFDRPLNGRGERDAPEMGSRLAKAGIIPDLMLSSPANRALTTCKTIAKQIKYPLDAIITDQKIYHAGVNSLIQVIQQIDDTFTTVFLFGHNPGFTDLANALTNDFLDNIPTCGVYGCTFEAMTWGSVKAGTAKRIYYNYPKKRNDNP